MTNLTRRHFMRVSARSLGTLVISTSLSQCSSGGSHSQDRSDSNSGETPANPDRHTDVQEPERTEPTTATFDHGVASGDPQQDALILWTRATPLVEGPVTVRWEIALNADFTELTHRGETITDGSRDWTVKIDARELIPGTVYYYRFANGSELSPVGRARTLPLGAVESVRLAVVSCSNYPAGYFHVYREIADNESVDAIVHLGDYIYEDGMGGFATEDAEALGRTLDDGNQTEAITLADYRARYATYRRDPDLQAAHASAAFIAVLDDHEIANNVWREGAQNHDASEGDFDERVAAAVQAWFEWMPIRPRASASEHDTHSGVYRHFDFGDLVALNMLDARQSGRDEAVDRNDYIDPSSRTLNSVEFQAALNDPNRTMLGDQQSLWLENRLIGSEARWQVLGQQVLMARTDVPAELRIDTERRGDVDNLSELLSIQTRLETDPTNVSDLERMRIETRVPYYQDSWDGYPAARESVLNVARDTNSNLVVLAGDTHNAWASNLSTADGTPVGAEFATTAISSPGLSRLFGVDTASAAATVESALTQLIDDVVYVNGLERGYLLVQFTDLEVTAEWFFVTTVKRRTYERAERRRTLRMAPGAGNRRIVG